MRRLILRLGLGIALVVSVTHALTMSIMASHFGQVRDRALGSWMQGAGEELVEALESLPAGERDQAGPELARAHGLQLTWGQERRHRRRLRAPPWVDSPVPARFVLSDGSSFSLAPLVGSAPDPGDGLLLLLPSVMLVGLVAYWLFRPIHRDLSRLEEDVRLVGGNDLSRRVREPAVEALLPLAQGLNHMAARVEGTVQAQREMIQALSHALRTPLARLHFRLDELEGSDQGAAREAARRQAEGDLELVDALLEELMAYLRADVDALPSEEWSGTLAEELEALVVHLTPLRPEIPLALRCAPDLPPPPMAQRWLQRAVENLVTNAQRHALGQVRIEVEDRPAGLELRVLDDGPGFPDEVLAHPGTPFLTMKRPGESRSGGLGLGLAVARRLVERARGKLELENLPAGALARLVWPK